MGQNNSFQNISVKLAETREELESAFHLLQLAHYEAGFAKVKNGLWLNKYYTMPTTNTFIAICDTRVIGAISLFGESAFRLPIESELDLKRLKLSLGKERLGELSLCAVDPEEKNADDIAYSLFHYAVCFSSIFSHHSLLITSAPENKYKFYLEKLGFAPFLTDNFTKGRVMTLRVLEIADHTHYKQGAFHAEYKFPEKKFYLVNHHVMHPDLLDYFFNRKSRVFAELNDRELLLLRSVYSFGKYASILPKRETSIVFSSLPKQKRYEMSCEGFLSRRDGKIVNFQVCDVSANGLKIVTDSRVPIGEVYVLNISIGVLKNAEVVAASLWARDDQNLVGLEVKSADENWKKLIQYLEADFQSQAA